MPKKFKTISAMFASFPKAPVSKLDLNIWNFLIGSGRISDHADGLAEYAVWVFKHSFDIGRFYTGDTERPWQPRKNPGDGHPVLFDTGTLRDSITWKSEQSLGKFGIKIFTDPSRFGTARSHRGCCYADVHNTGYPPYVYGKSGVPAVQRQFIGYSTYIDEYIKKHSIEIFKGFPKSRVMAAL